VRWKGRAGVFRGTAQAARDAETRRELVSRGKALALSLVSQPVQANVTQVTWVADSPTDTSVPGRTSDTPLHRRSATRWGATVVSGVNRE
jgi:hypothetical protein